MRTYSLLVLSGSGALLLDSLDIFLDLRRLVLVLHPERLRARSTLAFFCGVSRHELTLSSLTLGGILAVILLCGLGPLSGVSKCLWVESPAKRVSEAGNWGDGAPFLAKMGENDVEKAFNEHLPHPYVRQGRNGSRFKHGALASHEFLPSSTAGCFFSALALERADQLFIFNRARSTTSYSDNTPSDSRLRL